MSEIFANRCAREIFYISWEFIFANSLKIVFGDLIFERENKFNILKSQ